MVHMMVVKSVKQRPLRDGKSPEGECPLSDHGHTVDLAGEVVVT